MAAGAAWAAQSYNVAPGSNTMINEHGVCNRVNPPAGPNVFVPTNTSGEWSAFRSAAAGLGITLSSCGCSAGSVGTCNSGVLSEGATGGSCTNGYSGTCANLCSGGSLSASSNSCSINTYTMTVSMNPACGSVTGGNGTFNYATHSYPSVSLSAGSTLDSWSLAPFGVINCSNTVYDCYAGAAAGGYAGQTTVSVWMDSNKTITANCTPGSYCGDATCDCPNESALSCASDCNVSSCPNCTMPDSTVIVHGYGGPAYPTPTVPCGDICDGPGYSYGETRNCWMGVLSGSYGYSTCSVEACGPCCGGQCDSNADCGGDNCCDAASPSSYCSALPCP